MTNDAERVSDIVAKLRALAKKWGFEEEGGPSHGRLQVADEAADIIEAQSKALAEARVVKLLEWRELPLGNAFSAEPNLGGYYNVYEADDGKFIWLRNGSTELDRTHYQTMTEAKAAAQADYATRILSALATPTPENPNG
jgi:hypothetical protein